MSVLRWAIFLFICQRGNFSFLPVMRVWLQFSVYTMDETIIPDWDINCRKQMIRGGFFFRLQKEATLQEHLISPACSHIFGS